jgi:hypothetical protein
MDIDPGIDKVKKIIGGLTKNEVMVAIPPNMILQQEFSNWHTLCLAILHQPNNIKNSIQTAVITKRVAQNIHRGLKQKQKVAAEQQKRVARQLEGKLNSFDSYSVLLTPGHRV